MNTLKPEKFVKLNLNSPVLLIKFKSPDTLRIFFFLVQKLRWNCNNCVYIKQEELVKKLNMSNRQSVGRAMRPLFEKNMIKRISGGGYRLNSNIVSIGSSNKEKND